jgi:hypothetical protein
MSDELPCLHGELEIRRCGITPLLRGFDFGDLVKGLLNLDHLEQFEVLLLGRCKPAATYFDLSPLIHFVTLNKKGSTSVG